MKKQKHTYQIFQLIPVNSWVWSDFVLWLKCPCKILFQYRVPSFSHSYTWLLAHLALSVCWLDARARYDYSSGGTYGDGWNKSQPIFSGKLHLTMYCFLEKFVPLLWQWLLWNYHSQPNLQLFRMACSMTKFPQKAKPFSLFLIKPKCMHLPGFLHQKGQVRGLLAICKTRRALVTTSWERAIISSVKLIWELALISIKVLWFL